MVAIEDENRCDDDNELVAGSLVWQFTNSKISTMMKPPSYEFLHMQNQHLSQTWT